MIDFNGMENRKFAMIDAVLKTKAKCKDLVIAVILKSSDWVVNWEWFADDLKVGKSSIYRWLKQASKLGVWRVDKNNNVEFLPDFFSAILGKNIILKQDGESAILGNGSVKMGMSAILGHNKHYIGKNLKFTEKHHKEQESACVREIDNVECETSQNLDKAHEIGQISENVALSAQISADFAEFETSQTQENENRAEIFCAGGENLTQINFGEGVARTAQHSTASEQGSGAVALGLQKIAFSSSAKPAKMSIGEAYANWQRQIQAAAENSWGGEKLTKINKTSERVAWQNEINETNEQDEANEPREAQQQRQENDTLQPERTNTAQNIAQTSPKMAQSTAKKAKANKQVATPESIAETLYKTHEKIAESANFSESEREAVLDYFAYKAEHKKYPLTERNSKAILKQCVKIKGENKDLPEIIERTIANGWADLRWVADKPAQNAYKSAWQQQKEQEKASWQAIMEKYRPKNEQKQAQKAV